MRRGPLHAAALSLPAAGPLIYAALSLATGQDALVYLVLREAALALAAGACLGAVLAFHRGEYMWWAWVALAATYGLGAIDNLLPGTGGWTDGLRLGLYAALNLAGLAGALLFAMATLRGGLGLPGTPALKGAVIGATALVAVALTAPAVRVSLGQLAAGQPASDVAGDLLSTVSDGLCFALGAPLLVIAVALRGSALATTFWLLAASNASWLLNDQLSALSRAAPGLRVPGHALLIAACLATASAAWVHRRAARAAAHPANEPAEHRVAS